MWGRQCVYIYMKDLLKGIVYSVSRVFSKIKTTSFSELFISWGYMIRSEALYYHSKIPAFKDRWEMHEHLVTKHLDPEEKIHFLEFGVYKGQSFYIWVDGHKHPESRFAGFDTFTGLPEDWGNIKKGSFSAGGNLPAYITDPRSKFHVGLIQDTLPVFIPTLSPGHRKVIHIDVDIYNATLFTLIQLHPHLRPGDIIIFDDFFTITKAAHEFKAFYDYLDLYHMPYKPLYKCRMGHLVIEITGRPANASAA